MSGAVIRAAALFSGLLLSAQLGWAQVSMQPTTREGLNQLRQSLFLNGYKSWAWLESDCRDCNIVFLSERPELHTPKVQAFIRALENSKAEIVAMYQADPQEYNLLAQMAIGILGRESKFFESRRYRLKEDYPTLVSVVKAVQAYLNGRSPSASSRGPTQIKIVPELIENRYGVTPDNLWVPENAARATMGFLIEALAELKQRARNNRWEFVTPETYADYLPYIYFGAVGQLRNRTATPETNLYIREMKGYMGWLEMYERPGPHLAP